MIQSRSTLQSKPWQDGRNESKYNINHNQCEWNYLVIRQNANLKNGKIVSSDKIDLKTKGLLDIKRITT